jgi:hypothetical protein
MRSLRTTINSSVRLGVRTVSPASVAPWLVKDFSTNICLHAWVLIHWLLQTFDFLVLELCCMAKLVFYFKRDCTHSDGVVWFGGWAKKQLYSFNQVPWR